MFEMIIYVLYFSLSRNNRRLQEFQSTCRQVIIPTVASTDATITNMHFLFVTTFIGDSEDQIIRFIHITYNTYNTLYDQIIHIKVKCWEEESQKY